MIVNSHPFYFAIERVMFMAITQYGSDTLIPENFKPFRGIATDMGFYKDDIGYDVDSKSPTLFGTKFDPSQYVLGSDERYYADPTIVQQQIYAAGLKGTAPGTYTNPYQTQIQSSIDNVANHMNKPFSWNPATDTALQQAQKQAQESTMAQTNARGILNSTITTDRMAQNTAMLIPQYEQLAYERWQDEGTRLMNFANFWQNLDDTSYQRFADQWEMDTKARNDAYARKMDEYNKAQDSISNAYKKLEALDYVDNEISQLTGLPVGMKSIEAQRRLQDRQWQIEDDYRALEIEKQTDDYKTRNEINVINARGTGGSSSTDISSMGTPEEQQRYYDVRNNFFAVADGTANGDIVSLYKWLTSTGEAPTKSAMGSKLYAQLVKDVQGRMKMNEGFAPEEEKPLGASDYKTDPDFAEDVQDAKSDPAGFVAYFDANAQAYIQKYGTDGYNYLYKIVHP